MSCTQRWGPPECFVATLFAAPKQAQSAIIPGELLSI